jgi:hypothetical protein
MNQPQNPPNFQYHQNPPNMQESQIVNMPYSDHVGELKYLRKENPDLFITNNELSRKKLPPIEETEHENNRNSLNTKNGNSKGNFEKLSEDPRDKYEVNSRFMEDSQGLDSSEQGQNSRFQPVQPVQR